MKTIRLTLLIWAATFAALSASCGKQDALESDQEPAPEMVTITFSAEKAGESTRTAAVEGFSEVNYIWTREDEANMKLFLVDKSAPPETVTPVDNYTVSLESPKRLKITATVPSAPSYTFRAVLVSSVNGDNEPVAAADQSPLTGNFDPSADLLVSDDLTTSGTSGLLMLFNRKIVANKMTLRGLTEGEKVCRVTIASDKYLTGSYSDGTFTGLEKMIALTYDKEVVAADGTFPVYFTSIPAEDQTLTVDVTTDQRTYTKTFGAGGIDFTLDEFTRFGVTISSNSAPVADLVDAIFLADGTGVNLAAQTSNSPLIIETKAGDYLTIAYDASYKRRFARFGRNIGSESFSDSYYKINYESNSAVKDIISAGHTLEALVKISPDANVQTGEYKFFSSHQSGGFGLIMKGSCFKYLPYIGGWFWTPNTGADKASNTAEKDVYYHVVGSWDDATKTTKLYVDGVLVDTRVATGTLAFPSAGSQWIGIGGDPLAGSIAQVWKGDIAIARIYGRALTDEEVGKLYDRVHSWLGLQ